MGHKQDRKASRREWFGLNGRKYRARCLTCTLSCEVTREFNGELGYYNYNTCPFKEDK
jgi:hypothetical protein